MRTLKGDIDFADGADGDFTALWESAQVELKLLEMGTFSKDRAGYVSTLTLAAFRSRINASSDEHGTKFNLNKGEKRIALKLGYVFDSSYELFP